MPSQADPFQRPPPRGLHVAVHDVAPRHRSRLERIDAFLAGLGVGRRYSMLVVPDFHRGGPLTGDAAFAGWLRSLAASGVEMLLHGFYHLDESRHETVRSRWLARHMTASEGEFLGLGYGEAFRRLAEGRRMVEDAVGRPVEGFVAPAWLYGPEIRRALADEGFRLAEDHLTVWSPLTGRRLLRSPVVSWASRSPGRLRKSVIWSRLATVVLKPLARVRVGIHPHDFDHRALVTEAERVLRSFLKNREPFLLRDLPDGREERGEA